MIKLKALQAFEDQDGSFEAGEEFLVNDERAFYLTRTGKALRCDDQSVVSVASADDVELAPSFGVPRRPA